MSRWLQRWSAWRRARTLERRPIPEELWQDTLAQFPFLRQRPAPAVQRLRELSTLFLADKEFSGASGLQVTDAMAVAIAAQACLPVLELGLGCYGGFVGIVVHPDPVAARRETMDEIGVVHRFTEELSGEAMDGGPLMLAWSDVAEAGESAAWGYNVVIHEFVHVLDLHAARAGVPPGGGGASWARRLADEHTRFVERVEAGEDTLLDPYGAEAIEEFLAVAAEGFFVASGELKDEEPRLYGLLVDFFRQDPEADARRCCNEQGTANR